ncbi:Fur family transcriptional regulator [Sulfurospirillum barnesii]|uniref:Fe2+/Zn2+ uptake regulation protein n=1 Tax=Sulfurospirillum barnesii (strain ATCC 700032 / DSM 10660 / SES-3) TaxID=760154 RepID=I3XUE3_SULBS|nr:transcriptional repressor [Sulfurospirillum barnesii]AFL67567.1 Fe2+/Zn2+ uptake regulation protein [Sulfurospirillum barnesii SES-3]
MYDVIQLLKDKELKATPQRISVLKELGRKTHPTMDDLYEALKKENPSMSLATVYKNISTLKEKGVVIEVNVADGKMRYDVYSKPHIHLICQQCGSIEDVDCDESMYQYQMCLESNQHVKIERMDIIATVKSCSLCPK